MGFSRKQMKAWGVDVPAAPRPKRPRKPAEPAPPPSGLELCRFTVEGRAVPWKAPTVTQNGGTFKDRTLVAWQEMVAGAARRAWGNREPYAGRVELEFTVHIRGKRRGDATNLQKSIEDSMQSVVISNDKNVVRISTTVREIVDPDEPDRVDIVVRG